MKEDSDPEAVFVPPSSDTFDHAIVLGDVLEHLRNPGDVLQRLAKRLKPGGKVLMSLPNVANIWVRLNLLLGRFNYTHVGILDESHLRLFKLQTSKKLAYDSGLDVVGINTTPIPLPILLPATQQCRSYLFARQRTDRQRNFSSLKSWFEFGLIWNLNPYGCLSYRSSNGHTVIMSNMIK